MYTYYDKVWYAYFYVTKLFVTKRFFSIKAYQKKNDFFNIYFKKYNKIIIPRVVITFCVELSKKENMYTLLEGIGERERERESIFAKVVKDIDIYVHLLLLKEEYIFVIFNYCDDVLHRVNV